MFDFEKLDIYQKSKRFNHDVLVLLSQEKNIEKVTRDQLRRASLSIMLNIAEGTSRFRQILYHIVFATKNREHTVPDSSCEDLYRYIWGIIAHNKGKLYRINGAEDYIHIACDLHPSVALADFLKEIKGSSSKWIKENNAEKFPEFQGWGEGYGAFIVSWKDKDQLIRYIMGQKEHHKKIDFISEYKLILEEHGIAYDPKYLP